MIDANGLPVSKELALNDDLAYMQECVYKTAVDHGWWEGPAAPNIPEKLALIHSEISEALEDYRAGGGLQNIYYDANEKPEGFAVELADAVIRIMDLCGHLGINLAEAIAVKHNYNLTRAYRHGGKLA